MWYQKTQGFFLSVPERALRSGLFKNQQKPVAGKTNNDPWSSSLRSSVQLATGVVMGLMVLKPVGAIASTPVHSVPLSAANFSAIENNATGHYHLTENICFGNAEFCSQYPNTGVSNATLPFFPSSSNPFRGTLDGKGYSITGISNGNPFIQYVDSIHMSNVTINEASAVYSVLFGVINGGVQTNTTINNSTIENHRTDNAFSLGFLAHSLHGNDTQTSVQGTGNRMISQQQANDPKGTALVVGSLGIAETAANNNNIYQNNIIDNHIIIRDKQNSSGLGIGLVYNGIYNKLEQNNIQNSSITLEQNDYNVNVGAGIGWVRSPAQINLIQTNFNNVTVEVKNINNHHSKEDASAIGIGYASTNYPVFIKQQGLNTTIISSSLYVSQGIGLHSSDKPYNIYMINNNADIIAKNGTQYVSFSANNLQGYSNKRIYLFSGKVIVEDQGANLDPNQVGLVNNDMFNFVSPPFTFNPSSTYRRCIVNGFVDNDGFTMRWKNGTAIEHPGSCVQIHSVLGAFNPLALNPVYHTAQNATQWHLAHDVLNTKAQNCPNDRLGTYVNEIPQTLFMNQHQQMGLITRQTYPFTADREEENGVMGAADKQGIYIVHWAEPIVDSTDNGLSKTSNSIWYEPESLDQAVPVTAVYTDHVVDGDHLSMLFNNGTETLVSTFPLEQGATQGVYNTTSIPITGEAITINQNSLLSKANDTLFYYKKANDYAIATEYRFNQTDTQLLAATETGDSVFIAGVTGANHTLVIEKYLKDTEQRDTAFGTVEITQDLPINPNGSYHLVLENGQLHLKEKVLLLQSQGENSTGIAASTKPEGGCGSYHTHPVNVYDVIHTTPVEPEPFLTEYNLTSSTDLLSGSSSDIGASGGPILTSTPIIPGIPTEDNDLTPVYIGLSVTVGAITVAALTITGVVLYKVVKNRMGAYDMRGVINAKAMEMQPAKH